MKFKVSKPPKGHIYACQVTLIDGTYYNGIGEAINPKSGKLVRIKECAGKEYMFFRKVSK